MKNSTTREEFGCRGMSNVEQFIYDNIDILSEEQMVILNRLWISYSNFWNSRFANESDGSFTFIGEIGYRSSIDKWARKHCDRNGINIEEYSSPFFKRVKVSLDLV